MPSKTEIANALDKEIIRSQNKIAFIEKQLHIDTKSVASVPTKPAWMSQISKS